MRLPRKRLPSLTSGSRTQSWLPVLAIGLLVVKNVFYSSIPGFRWDDVAILAKVNTAFYNDETETTTTAPTTAPTTAATKRPLQAEPLGEHPFVGAIDPTGEYFGYVHDPTVLRSKSNSKNDNDQHKHENNPWEFSIRDETEREGLCAPVGYGPERWNSTVWNERNVGFDSSNAVFGEIIKVASPPLATGGSDNNNNSDRDIKLFCAIYTHPGNDEQANAIRQTWGRRCDGFMAASTVSDPWSATVNIPHKVHKKNKKFSQQGSYGGIWQRVRSMLAYLYDNFLEDYDFYYLCGDDTYLIVENLKAFLKTPAFVEHAGGTGYPLPVYTGVWIHPNWAPSVRKKKDKEDPSFYYMGGGAGYVLNRKAVELLVTLAWPKCHDNTFAGEEDVLMAFCLRQYLNVTGYDSRDEEERERFFWWDLVTEAEVREQSINEERKVLHLAGQFVRKQTRWNAKHHGWTPRYGPHDRISPTAVAFHKVKPAEKMKRYERLFYRTEARNPALHQKDCGLGLG